MRDNVVGLHGTKPAALGEPNQVLIDVLEDALARAKSGQLQSFVGTGFMADGCRLGLWADLHENVYEMMGALQWLVAEYTHRHTEALGG